MTQIALPPAPAIPSSNASYAKIIDKIQKASLHGPEAVKLILNSVKGTNTYCRIVRRYGQAVLDVITPPADPAEQKASDALIAIAAKAKKPTPAKAKAAPKKKAPAKKKVAA